jgi:uncharacterized protein
VVAEPGSQAATQAWTAADSVLAARLLYPEARAVLAAAQRSGRVARGLYRGRKAALDELWREFDVVEITPALAQSAGDLAEQFGLRGYDAVHLAAALHVQPDAIASADADLLRAASIHNLGIIDARS